MRPKRAVSWMMAVSPLFFVGYLTLTARLGSGGDLILDGDPEGFADRLESYIPFIRAVDSLEGPEAAGEKLDRVLAEATRSLPRLESTRFGFGASADVRIPVAEAQRKAFDAAHRQLLEESKAGRHWDAALTAVGALAVADLLRFADSETLSRSTGQQAAIVGTLRKTIPHLDTEQLERLSHRLIAYEARRGTVLTVLRNEMHLLTLESRCWPPDSDRPGSLSVVSRALKSCSSGESLEPFIKRTAKWPPGKRRDDVWSTLSAWEIALRSEDQSQRMVRSLIVEVRSRQLALRDEKFDTLAALRLPATIFAESVRGMSPRIVASEREARLEYQNPAGPVVAFR